MERPNGFGARCEKPCKLMGSPAARQWARSGELGLSAEIVADGCLGASQLVHQVIPETISTAEASVLGRFGEDDEPFSRRVQPGVDAHPERGSALHGGQELADGLHERGGEGAVVRRSEQARRLPEEGERRLLPFVARRVRVRAVERHRSASGGWANSASIPAGT